MKEEYLYKKAKKIRNKLIYFIHIQLKKRSKKNNILLINSLTPKELNKKYQNCSDYCVEKIETYSSSQMNNGIDNNNYFHVSVTYCSANNNYHMLIDNKNINQMFGPNNIIGKYYKGNSVHVRTTASTINYNINENDNKFEKIIISDKKLIKKKRMVCSSLDITKNILSNAVNFNNNFNYNDNDNDNIPNLNDLNSNRNNYKKLISTNTNNEINKKLQTNFQNKTKKLKNQKVINIYATKLKKYCSTLKIIKKKETNNYNKLKNQKQLILGSPDITDGKKSYKRERNYTLKSEKEQPKMHAPFFAKKQFHRLHTENQNNSNNKNNLNSKLKSQTRISQNLFKIPEKKNIHRKNRAQSIDISEGKNVSVKKPSPKKLSSPKKIISPKKLINSMKIKDDPQFSNLLQKYNKKSKANDANIKKYISGGIDNKRKMFNANNVNFKYTNTNAINILNAFKTKADMNKKPVNRKFKRANTGISKIYHFRGHEIKSKEKEK